MGEAKLAKNGSATERDHQVAEVCFDIASRYETDLQKKRGYERLKDECRLALGNQENSVTEQLKKINTPSEGIVYVEPEIVHAKNNTDQK